MTSYSGEASRVEARVDLPEPLGPIRACTSPAATVRSTPVQDLRGAADVGRARSPSIWKRGADMRPSLLALWR